MHKRYHPKFKRNMIIIQPGEYYVTKEDEVIATVLGSCISVCLRDEKNRIGGMNHFMLPGDFSRASTFETQSARYGMYAMELILGDIIKLGGDRQHLTAKVFGGGHVLNSVGPRPNSVPMANIQFVKAYLSMEGIPIVKADVGGRYGRKVLYLPYSGKAYVKPLLPAAQKRLVAQERRYQRHLRKDMEREELVLFE